MYKKYRKTVFIFITLFVLLSISYTSSSNTNKKFMIKVDTQSQEPQPPYISGPDHAELRENCKYNISSIDPQGDDVCFHIKCSDCINTVKDEYISDMYRSGEKFEYCHCWDDFYQKENPFILYAQAEDEYGHKSDWATYEVTIDNAIIDDIPITINYNFLKDIYDFIIFLLNILENIFI